jgi:hypothetical protein
MTELPTIKLKGLKHHQAAGIFPMLDEKSAGFQATYEDIKANGMHTPVWMHNDEVLEGRHRVRILEMLGKEELRPCADYRNYEGNDPIGFVISMNLHRRHLNESQRAMVAAKLASLEVGANQHGKGQGTSIDVASKLLNVGRASIDRAKVVLAKGDPSLIAAVEQGDVAVSAAAAAAEAKQQEQSQTTTTPRQQRQSTPLDRFENAWDKLDLPMQQAFVEAKYNDISKLMKEVDRKEKKAA